MIARDVEIVDLAPDLWRSFFEFWRMEAVAEEYPENPNAVAILHKGGTVLRMHIPEGHRVSPISKVDDPQVLAKQLFKQYAGVDGVEIFEIESIRMFSQRLQQADWQAMDYDDFFFFAHQLIDQDPAGLCFFPPPTLAWKGFSIPAIRSWLESLPDPCAVILGIYRNAAPWFSLIVKLVDKKIRLVTTMEYLARSNPYALDLPSSASHLKAMAYLVAENVAPVAAAVVFDYSVLPELLAAERKEETFKRVMADGNAAAFGLPISGLEG